MDEQLRSAFSEQDLPTVRRILQQPGFNVNADINELGWKALHYAADCRVVGIVHIVQAILQADGVNVNARTR